MSNVFVRAHLQKLDALEFVQRANGLRELEQHPGWAFLQELLDAQLAQAEKVFGKVDPARTAVQIAEDPLKAAVRMADVGGQLKGLRAIATTLSTAIETATQVQAQIEAEG